MLGAVFDGTAGGPGPEDPQSRDRHGLNFRVFISKIPAWCF
jgi:porin